MHKIAQSKKQAQQYGAGALLGWCKSFLSYQFSWRPLVSLEKGYETEHYIRHEEKRAHQVQVPV
jgi:hypothetical protein